MLGGLGLEPASFNRPKPLLLLAYLAVEGRREKRHLYELFWPEAADPATSLRMAVSQIRKASPLLLSADDRTLGTEIESDFQALQAALSSQDALKASELYGGGFLAEFSLPDWSAELEEWVYSTREFVARGVRGAMLRQAEAEAARGAFDQSVQWADRAFGLSKEPEPEDLERLYPLLLAGDSALASEAKRRAAEYSLEFTINRQEARARYFVAAATERAEAREVPHNLPRPKTSFVGRDPELLELGRMLAAREARLITLLGPGGMGKTRLALQLASNQLLEDNFPDGVYFVALEALSEPGQIPLALAQTLRIKVKDDPLAEVGVGIGERQMLLVLDNFEHLTEGALLISELLEACPQLAIVATSRERLNLEEEYLLPLQGLPLPKETPFAEAGYIDAVRLFVVRAKRARLDFELSPENLPHVLEICRLVDGSPLGIELAAVWVRSLPLDELAREIAKDLGVLETTSRNILERHQSLRAVFEYSWRLLKPREQLTLARLSSFLGGFTREAASAVAEATIPLLASLVDKSLLRLSPEGRYDFHPLLYGYAQEKLTELPQERAQTRSRHANYYLTLLEAQDPSSPDYLERCRSEYQNLLAALAWTQEADQALLGLRLGRALARFWENHSYASQGRHWLSVVLAHPGAASPSPERAWVLLYAGRIASRQSDHAPAERYAREALEISQALGLEGLSIRALILFANEANNHGDAEGGKRHAEAALALARKLGDEELAASTLVMLGSLEEGLGNLETARAYFEESLGLVRKLGRQKTTEFSINLINLGYMAWLQGDLGAARAYLEEGLAVAQELNHLLLLSVAQDNLSLVTLDSGELAETRRLAKAALEYRFAQNDRWGLCFSLENLACLAVAQHQAERAARLWGAAQQLREEIASPRVGSWQVRQDGFMARAMAQLEEASFTRTLREGQEMGLEAAVGYAAADEPEPQTVRSDVSARTRL